MRRILLVVAMAAVAVGVGVPAQAVTTSCAKPMTVVGETKVGVDVGTSGATFCLDLNRVTRFEIGGSAVTFTYGGTSGIGGGGGHFCWYEGADYTCASVGTGGAWGAWLTPDVVSVALMPSACVTTATSPWDHCFAVFLFAGADGPLGPTTGAGGGVFVCEAYGGGLYCPVQEYRWEDLRDERQKVYDLLKPITITTA